MCKKIIFFEKKRKICYLVWKKSFSSNVNKSLFFSFLFFGGCQMMSLFTHKCVQFTELFVFCKYRRVHDFFLNFLFHNECRTIVTDQLPVVLVDVPWHVLIVALNDPQVNQFLSAMLEQ